MKRLEVAYNSPNEWQWEKFDIRKIRKDHWTNERSQIEKYKDLTLTPSRDRINFENLIRFADQAICRNVDIQVYLII